MTSENWLESADQISRIVSALAVPLIIGVGGWVIQRRLQNQSIRTDYVKLALSILQNPDASKLQPEIRELAVDLFVANAPTKLNPETVEKLKKGSVALPPLSFVGTPLPLEVERKLQASVDGFKGYMAQLGFAVPSGNVSVNVHDGEVFTADDGGPAVAIWDPKTNTINVAEGFATDSASVLRQFAHALLLTVTTAPWDYCAIESGLASYFPCSFTRQPILGSEVSSAGQSIFPPRDLRNTRRFAEIDLSEWSSIQNDGSEVWGAAMWQLRELLSAPKADRLIADTWRALRAEQEAGKAYATFAHSLLVGSASIDEGKYSEGVRKVFEQRGLRFSKMRAQS